MGPCHTCYNYSTTHCYATQPATAHAQPEWPYLTKTKHTTATCGFLRQPYSHNLVNILQPVAIKAAHKHSNITITDKDIKISRDLLNKITYVISITWLTNAFLCFHFTLKAAPINAHFLNVYYKELHNLNKSIQQATKQQPHTKAQQ